MAPCIDCGNNDLRVNREGKCGECRERQRAIPAGWRAAWNRYYAAPPRCGWCGHDDYDCVCNGGER